MIEPARRKYRVDYNNIEEIRLDDITPQNYKNYIAYRDEFNRLVDNKFNKAYPKFEKKINYLEQRYRQLKSIEENLYNEKEKIESSFFKIGLNKKREELRVAGLKAQKYYNIFARMIDFLKYKLKGMCESIVEKENKKLYLIRNYVRHAEQEERRKLNEKKYQQQQQQTLSRGR